MGGGVIFNTLSSSVLFFAPMDRRVFHIKDKLSQNLGSPWSVDDMAAEVKMSATHFQRLFKEETGVTPMAYLNDLRLEKAREFLADSNCFLLIKEIRSYVGLMNDSHFTNDFKAKFGMTPTDFRDHQSKIHQSNPQNGQE